MDELTLETLRAYEWWLYALFAGLTMAALLQSGAVKGDDS
jgi:hypothetical protein